ncbi:MAG: class A beta-lactamase [bacterium]|jgi:beta-lactamase class A|nr:MAG: class A beta-lactamase [bacterium]
MDENAMVSGVAARGARPGWRTWRGRARRVVGASRVWFVAASAALLAVPGASAARAQPAAVAADPGLERLEREIARLAELAGGTVGVAAVHLETGRAVYLNRTERFPMASAYKVPIAVELLTRVDRGEVRLDSLIEIRPEDLHPGSGTLTSLFDDPGVILSVHNLLELMLLISDNSATDILLRLAGGAEAVTARMRAVGAEGIRVDRPTSLLIGDWLGVKGLPANGEISPAEFRKLADAVPQAQRDSAAAAFDADPRDTATPEAMARLLERIWRREILSAESTELLLDIMRRCETGEGRIKGMLPPWVEVAHKTGTIGGTTNDVGIISLPADAGHVVTVVFIKESQRPIPERERAIAFIARAIYDDFLFDPVTGPSSR